MAMAVLDEFGISECADRRWAALSNWQRVLVELAQAVVVQPRLILMDDLAGQFELRQKQTLMDLLDAIVRERDCGVLMVVSDDASALRAAHVWRLHRHKLRLMASPRSEAAGQANDVVIPFRQRKGEEGSSAERERC